MKPTFDAAKFFTCVAAILLIAGVLPFTALVVGLLIIAATCELKFS